MRDDADFFCQPPEQLRVDKKDVCCNFGLYVARLLVSYSSLPFFATYESKLISL
jgi:hypothetical protein